MSYSTRELEISEVLCHIESRYFSKYLKKSSFDLKEVKIDYHFNETDEKIVPYFFKFHNLDRFEVTDRRNVDCLMHLKNVRCTTRIILKESTIKFVKNLPLTYSFMNFKVLKMHNIKFENKMIESSFFKAFTYLDQLEEFENTAFSMAFEEFAFSGYVNSEREMEITEDMSKKCQVLSILLSKNRCYIKSTQKGKIERCRVIFIFQVLKDIDIELVNLCNGSDIIL